METQPRSATRPARGFTQRLKEDGRRTLEQRKRSAAERVEEIAQAIAFLLSEDSAFINGQTISVCGGRVMLP